MTPHANDREDWTEHQVEEEINDMYFYYDALPDLVKQVRAAERKGER